MIKLYLCARGELDEHKLGSALAEYALERNFGNGARLYKDERGKPRVTLAGCYVSISHSGGFCAVAVSDREVGLDIEVPKNRTRERLNSLARRYFTADELAYFELSPERRFYELWCAKESYVKYTGEGLSRGLTSFSVLDGTLGLNFHRLEPENALGAGLFGCVCTEHEQPPPCELIEKNNFYIQERTL